MRVNPLTQQEKDAVWKQVCLGMAVTPQKTSHKLHISSMFKRSIALTLIFGMTMGTASAANEAKPGDVLFPLDRAMENAHLYIVSNEKKDELKVKFALERVEEVKEIFSEITPKTKTSLKTGELPPEVIRDNPEPEKDPPSDLPTQVGGEETVANSDTPRSKSVDELEIEVRETVDVDMDKNADKDPSEDLSSEQTNADVKNPPTDGEKTDTETTVTTTDENNNPEDTEDDVPKETIDEIDDLTEILQGDVEMSDTDKKRIELALGTALDFLGCVKGELAEQGNVEAASSIDNLLKELNTEIETLPENIIFEVKLSSKKQKVQFEITSEDNKDVVQLVEVPVDENNEEGDEIERLDEVSAKPKETKLEIKDGTLSIKTEGDDDSLEEEKTVSEEEIIPDESGDEEKTDDEKVVDEKTGEGEESEGKQPIDDKDSAPTEDSGVIKPAVTEESSGEAKQEQSTTDILNDNENPPTDDETTTVKVIIKKLDEDLEFSITDENGNFHKIIEEYTDEKGDA